MPTWAKVLIVLGALVTVLVVVLVAAGIYLVRRHGPELVERGKQVYSEGQEYGRGTDQQGCFDEGLARHRRSSGFGELIKTNLFLRACLEVSRETPGFCDDVPRQTEFVKSIKWQIDQCERHGLTTEKQCGQLFQQVQQFCEQRHGKPK